MVIVTKEVLDWWGQVCLQKMWVRCIQNGCFCADKAKLVGCIVSRCQGRVLLNDRHCLRLHFGF